MDRAKIRRAMLERRGSLEQSMVVHSSALVIEQIRSLDEFLNASVVAAYAGIRGEINPIGLLDASGPEVALPVMARDGTLRFLVSDGVLELGPFGIAQPKSGRLVKTHELGIVLVPVVAADLMGNRLGHGAGYYDRTFQEGHNEKLPLLIGLAHQFQIVDSIPAAPWDVPLDMLITETGPMELKSPNSVVP